MAAPPTCSAHTERYDAVLLDLGPPATGRPVAPARLARAGSPMPVLVLTARGGWHDKVEGIDSGADDYVGKPFQMEEVLARLRALIRAPSGLATPRSRSRCRRLDPRAASVTLDGTPVRLTSHEYRVLSYLMHHRGRVVSQTELTEHIYARERRPGLQHGRSVRRPAAPQAGRGAIRPCAASATGSRRSRDPPPLAEGAVHHRLGAVDPRLAGRFAPGVHLRHRSDFLARAGHPHWTVLGSWRWCSCSAGLPRCAAASRRSTSCGPARRGSRRRRRGSSRATIRRGAAARRRPERAARASRRGGAPRAGARPAIWRTA